jgi:hypothetical protein
MFSASKVQPRRGFSVVEHKEDGDRPERVQLLRLPENSSSHRKTCSRQRPEKGSCHAHRIQRDQEFRSGFTSFCSFSLNFYAKLCFLRIASVGNKGWTVLVMAAATYIHRISTFIDFLTICPQDLSGPGSEDAVTPLERRLYFSTAHYHLRAGCPALAVEVLSKLPGKIVENTNADSMIKSRGNVFERF